MYAEAVKNAGTVDKKSVAKAWEEVRVELPGGLTSFRAADHQALFPAVFGKPPTMPQDTEENSDA